MGKKVIDRSPAKDLQFIPHSGSSDMEGKVESMGDTDMDLIIGVEMNGAGNDLLDWVK